MSTKDKHDDVLTMPLDELKKRVDKVNALLAQAEELLPGLVTLTHEDRRTSAGRFRTGEASALGAVLTLADQKPALFESLAAKDEGHDPAVFEASLLRDRLERIALLQPVGEAFDGLIEGVQDTVAHLGEKTKPVLLTAYELAKPQAKHDDRIRSTLAPTLDFYGKIAQASVATRRKNQPQG